MKKKQKNKALNLFFAGIPPVIFKFVNYLNLFFIFKFVNIVIFKLLIFKRNKINGNECVIY